MKRKPEIEKFIKEDMEWGLYGKKNISSLFGKFKFKEDTAKIKQEMRKWWKC